MLRFKQRPSFLREIVEELPDNSLIIIDEIQQVPELLNEVHLLISRRQMRFILCGSSARKLRRNSANTLGGRALPCTLFPLVSAEIPDFNLNRAINNGMLPAIYPLENPVRHLQAYVDTYLKEEIQAEALVRNLSGFSNFLKAAAMTDGEMVNYQNIAQDCGVSAKTVKEYFNILTDTLIGYMLPAFTKTQKRGTIQAPKFYFLMWALSITFTEKQIRIGDSRIWPRLRASARTGNHRLFGLYQQQRNTFLLADLHGN